MYKKVILLAILAVTLLSFGTAGCGAIAARDPHWRDKYDPPYMGVKHAIYSYENSDPFAGILLLDLPATLIVDTCLLPWDLVTIITQDRQQKHKPKTEEPQQTDRDNTS